MTTKRECFNGFVLARLLMAIEKMGYTQRGYGVMIANATGFSRKDISCILSGQKRLSYQFLKSFCTAFGVSEAWLIEGEGDIFAGQLDTLTAANDLDGTDPYENSEAAIGRSKSYS